MTNTADRLFLLALMAWPCTSAACSGPATATTVTIASCDADPVWTPAQIAALRDAVSELQRGKGNPRELQKLLGSSPEYSAAFSSLGRAAHLLVPEHIGKDPAVASVVARRALELYNAVAVRVGEEARTIDSAAPPRR